VRVQLDRFGAMVSMLVSDDGIGFDPDRPPAPATAAHGLGIHTMRERARVLLADDHAILRAGLRMLLDAQPDMAVVAEAADGEEAIRRAGGSRPDVAVVDLSMPGLSGVETLERLRREVPSTRLLVLTMHDDPGYARLALAAGASGHVIKDAESAELLAAIRAVHRGRTFVQVGSEPAAPATLERPATPTLSPRER